MIKIKPGDLWVDHPRFNLNGSNRVKNTHTIGWVLSYCGHEYGDFVTIVGEKKVGKEILDECAEIMTDQANDTMLRVVAKEFISNSGGGWEEFCTSGLVALKNDSGILVRKQNGKSTK